MIQSTRSRRILCAALPCALALMQAGCAALDNATRDAPLLRTLYEAAPVAGLVAIVAFLYVRRTKRVWRRALQRTVRSAHALAFGEPATRIESEGDDEFAQLARTLNHLRDRLVGQVETISRQRETLALIINQLNEGVVAASGQGRIILINPAALRLLDLAGRTPEMLINLPVERGILQHSLQRMLVAADGEANAAGPQRGEARLTIEGPAVAVHLLARATDIHLPLVSGQETRLSAGRLLVLTDVTELAHTIQVKTDFVANASHELRTPISTIRAAVETLQSLAADDRENTTRFISVIDRQSRRLEALASDLLDLHRVESGTEQFEARDIDLEQFWIDVHGHFEDRLREKRLDWSVEAADGAPRTVVANPQLLQLIIDNLVDNAIKFTEPGGSVRAATRAAETAADGAARVILEVSDTGCGIPPEDIDRVFERFYQVERARSGHERGTGLGLSIVRHAAQVLGAELKLESELGKGTTVRVRLAR